MRTKVRHTESATAGPRSCCCLPAVGPGALRWGFFFFGWGSWLIGLRFVFGAWGRGLGASVRADVQMCECAWLAVGVFTLQFRSQELRESISRPASFSSVHGDRGDMETVSVHGFQMKPHRSHLVCDGTRVVGTRQCA